jgi:hypothetical protein
MPVFMMKNGWKPTMMWAAPGQTRRLSVQREDVPGLAVVVRRRMKL